MTLVLGLEVNQGKRSIALDARAPDGAEVLARAIRRSDVVLYNKLPAQAGRLGVAPAQVHAVNPRAVVAAVTAYGGLREGGWEDRPAYDPVVQALTGVMERFGGDRAPAVHGIASCIDYFTGFAAAYGTLVGLVARQRGRTHLVARTSLVRTAAWVQLPFVADPDAPQPRGLDAVGSHPGDRLHRVRDGWVHVVAADPPLDLGRRLSALTTLEALDLARRKGWAAAPVVGVRAARKAARAGAWAGSEVTPATPSGRLLAERHPAGERLWLADPTWLRSSATERRRLAHAPRPGQHTESVLDELGFDADDAARLRRSGAVSDGWATGASYVPA